jgi:tRNA(Ile)-lysidine synthase
LLDLLGKSDDLELVVAHFDHGMRDGSKDDAEFVRKLAEKHGLEFEAGQGKLGARASEEKAREARYKFLESIRQKHEAAAIVTAHHQDDVIETAIINILRGTGPRGLISLDSSDDVTRPLLEISKKEIYEYANANNLDWVEDESNSDTKYLRNNVRQILQAKLTGEDRDRILSYNKALKENYQEADELVDSINGYLFEDEATLRRQAFIFLPDDVANELVMRWLRRNDVTVNRQLVNRLSVVIKTGRAGSSYNIDKRYNLELSQKNAHLRHLS